MSGPSTVQWSGSFRKDDTVRKKPSIKALRNKLDQVFSEFIRQRDEGKPCISCGKMAPLQCGHFVRRQHKAGRWDEHNAHGQCVYCNKWGNGRELEHYEAIITKYGIDEARRIRSLQSTTVQFIRSDYEAMISRYQALLVALDSRDRP